MEGRPPEDPLTILDEAMAILEQVEEEVGRLAAKAREGERLSSGEVYRLYTLLVDLGDRLRRLRASVFEECGRATR